MSIDRLPDEILRHVYAHAGMMDACVLAQVSCNFRGVVDAPLLLRNKKQFVEGTYHRVMTLLDTSIKDTRDILDMIDEERSNIGLVKPDSRLYETFKFLNLGTASKGRTWEFRLLDMMMPHTEDVVDPTRPDHEFWGHQGPWTFARIVLSKLQSLRYLLMYAVWSLIDRRNGKTPILSESKFNYHLKNMRVFYADLLSFRKSVAYLTTPPVPEECFAK